MSFKKLNLQRGNIIDSIKTYGQINNFDSFIVPDKFEEKGPTRRRLELKINNKSVIVDFHFNSNGDTTIDLTPGGKTELKQEIAEHILKDNKCTLGSPDGATWFVVNSVDTEVVKDLTEYLKECAESCSVIKEEIESGIYQYEGPYKEKLTITHYSTNKLVVQGKPLLLFYEVIAVINELVDEDQIIGSFNEYYKVNIPKDAVETQMEVHLPNSYTVLTPKLKKSVKQAVYNLQIDGDMYDYTYLAFPALRALEGHLKNVVSKHGLQLQDGKFHFFDKDKSSGQFTMKNTCKQTVNCVKTVDYIERTYQHIHDRRHKYFHWEESVNGQDQTMVIENIGTARSVIVDAIRLINDYYIL